MSVLAVDSRSGGLNVTETVLNICGHVAGGLITATFILYNSRSNKVSKKPAAASAAKYIKVQSL